MTTQIDEHELEHLEKIVKLAQEIDDEYRLSMRIQCNADYADCHIALLFLELHVALNAVK